MALKLKPNCRQITNPKFISFFSSSSSNPDSNDAPSPTEDSSQTEPAQPKSSFASYFSDVKSSLKQQPQQNWNTSQSSLPRTRPSFSGFSSEKPPVKVASLDEIRKNLSEFRFRSATPSSPPDSNTPRPISLQELYNRNVIAKPGESRSQSQSGIGARGGDMSFAAIRESLKQLKPSNANVSRDNPVSLSSLKDSLRLRQNDSNAGPWFGGRPDSLPGAIFDKEMRQKREGDSSIPAGMKSEFVKMYNYDELGNRLRQLRPEGKVEGENWFSLTELNERLVKLREIEEREAASSTMAGIQFRDLRESLAKMKMNDEEKSARTTIRRLDVLGHLGRTPSYTMHPPKEQLVEKYFHPDNMSSAEKMKIELQKVRDEFKMSESDCGSARVQVAQLTTKIKHLSTALHKKDKHSRKGLQEMVQKRKKLLRYLRRTDWDSYCFVLSKLGLRDNPSYKMTT